MSRIQNPSLDWNDNNPFSAEFNDVYFYRQNGLAETKLVFLEANNLPWAWVGQPQFTIAETGFGTGLNFLATWQLFEQTARNGERLDFISFEKFPMHKGDLAKALDQWRDLLGSENVDRFLEIYPPRIPGFHRRWISDHITLTLVFDDALRGLKQLDCPVDAWYLDGFTPKKNTEMWQPELFTEMARLSHSQTTLASFTASGPVKRSLKEAGFEIKREKGFGYKYHRITGKFTGTNEKPVIQNPETVTIIGTGLAGSACAYALKRHGIDCVLIEKNEQLGQGASGNRFGLINPRVEAQDNPRNDAGLSAFSFANHILQDLENIEYRQDGALHLFSGEDKKTKLEKIYHQSGWLEPHIELREDGVFYKDSASVNTSALVKELLSATTIEFNKTIDENTLSNGPVILACGWGLHEFPFLKNLPLQPVRGQVTYAEIPDLHLNHPIMFGNYIAHVKNNLFCLGASFEQNNDKPEITETDDIKNIAAAASIIGAHETTITDHWAQIRTASRDRFPVVGEVQKDLYISGALGSHGIQFSLLHAEILACLMTKAPLPVGKDAMQALSVGRFKI
jgi:tRNA 5-methylaminomethyl-2-thiouridine biosynthesis bifunctional protein